MGKSKIENKEIVYDMIMTEALPRKLEEWYPGMCNMIYMRRLGEARKKWWDKGERLARIN